MIERQMVPVIAVMSVTHHDHSRIVLGYTDNNYPYYLAWRRDENDKTTFYDRDNKNRIWQTRYPDGGVEIFTYDDDNLGQVRTHQMTSGGTEHFRYDNRGLKTLSWPPATLPGDPNPENHPTRYFYYGPGNGRNDRIDRLWYVIDPRGHTTTFDYNKRGQVTRVTHHDGTFAQSFYNGDGTLAWSADENHPGAEWDENQRTRYVYDEYKRVTHVTNPMNETVSTSYAPWNGSGPLSHTTSSVYQTTSFLGRQTDCKYDRNFRKTEGTQAPNTPDAAVSSFAYDEVGNLITFTDPRLKITSYGYDDRNRQIWVRNDELNETTQFRYDPVGNKTREIRPDGVFRTWKYDEMNRVSHAYDWRTNELPRLDQTTAYERDDAGNARVITDAKGARYEYDYDELNRKKKATYPVDAIGVKRTETWLYDFAGNLKVYKNPAGQFKHLEHDELNRQRRAYWNGSDLSDTPNPNIGAETTTTFDDASRVTEIRTNGGETIVGFGYDHANRKIWEDQTVAGYPTRRVKTDLDGDGKRENLQIVHPPEEGGAFGGIMVVSPEMSGSGQYSVAYEYTHRNQMKKISGEDWRFEYSYDGNGNMTTRQAFYHGVSSLTQCPGENCYDALNRPARWEQSGPNGFQELRHYRYDRANREEANWRDGDDNRGELFAYEVTNQLRRALYNAPIPPPGPTPPPPTPPPTPPPGPPPTPPPIPLPSPTPTSTPTPGQQVAMPTFNPDDGFPFYTAGPQTIEVRTDTTDAQMRYTINGQMPTREYGTLIDGPIGQATLTPLPPPDGTTLRAIAFQDGLADSEVYSATYFYEEGDGGGNPMPGQRTVTYTYTPDKLNRTTVRDSATGQTTSYAPNQLNQYTNVGGIAYSYDHKFNLTGAGGFGGVYDAANRLVSAWNSATAAQAEVQLVYDGLGRCVKRTIGGVATIILYNDWKPIAEWDGWTEDYFQAWNVYGLGADEILLRHDAKMGYVRYHPDANGNVKFLLDNDGAVVEKYTYDVFGQPKITDGYGNARDFSWWHNQFMFQGREYIEELGVYDYRNRFYHPELGRFLQVDPIGFDAGDMNLFRYCGGDPVDRNDPLGLLGEDYSFAEAERAARGWVKREAFGQTAKSDPVLKRPTTHGKLVPILSKENGRYELGNMSTGITVKEFQKNGVPAYYDQEKPDVTSEQSRRIAKLIHSHQDKTGPSARKAWSEKDKHVVKQGIPVERVDESNPGVWVVREPARTKAGYTEHRVDDAGRRIPSSSASNSNNSDPAAAPDAATVDKNHQGTGVPSMGAESVNFAPGAR
jgi:RHS repeat-associated protein